MSTYTYSLAVDFSNNLNSSQFHGEIDADPGIVPILQAVNVTADVVDVVFDSALSAGEKTTLDGLVAADVPIIIGKSIQVIFVGNKVTYTVYFNLSNYTFDPDLINTVNHIEAITEMNSGGTSYSLRVMDRNSSNTVAEMTGQSNTTPTIIDFGTISNVPTSDAIFELHAKVADTNTTLTVKSWTIIYS